MKKRSRNFGRRNKRRGVPRRGMLQPSLHADGKMPMPLWINPNQQFQAVFRNYIQAQSDSKGILAGSIPFDPSATLSSTFNAAVLFPEWSSYSGFWSQVKVRRFEIQMVRLYTDDTKGDNYAPIAIASNPSAILVVPSSYAQAIDNGDSQLWNSVQDYSGVNKYHAVNMTQVSWASVATPNPGSSTGIACGCPGQIQMYDNFLPNSTQIYGIKVSGHYTFRGRV